MIRFVGCTIGGACLLWGIYNFGYLLDGVINSKGPDYFKALHRIESVDCKYEFMQTEAEYEHHEKLSGTQIKDLIEIVAINSCGIDTHMQMRDATIEGIKLIHLKGKSAVIMTTVDAMKDEKVNKCEKSFDLVKLICPTTLNNAVY